MIRVVYFGTYDTDYSRNRVLIKGLKENGIEVIECHFGLWKLVKRNDYGLLNLIKLIVLFPYCFLKLLIKYSKVGQHDRVIVGYPGFIDMLYARLIVRGKPLIFDAFLSLYDSIVIDRANVQQNTFKAKMLYYIEKKAYRNADIVLYDTQVHINYVSELFNITPAKFVVVPIGADDTYFKPAKLGNANNVVWWGTHIPLQGFEYIWAAVVDTKTKLTAIGPVINLPAANIKYLGFIHTENLGRIAQDSGIALGIFGRTPKTQRVVPNKVFEAMALGMPVITADTEAIKDAGIIHKESAYLVPTANIAALRAAIKDLAHDKPLRDKIAKGGLALYQAKYTPKQIVKDLLERI